MLVYSNSRGCTQVEASSKATHLVFAPPLSSQPSSALHVARTPPPPNPADADDARPLGGSASHSKISKASPRAAECS